MGHSDSLTKWVRRQARPVNANDAELWGGIALLVVSGAILFSPLLVAFEYTLVLLVGGVAGLAVGSVLVGLSRRGRAA